MYPTKERKRKGRHNEKHEKPRQKQAFNTPQNTISSSTTHTHDANKMNQQKQRRRQKKNQRTNPAAYKKITPFISNRRVA